MNITGLIIALVLPAFLGVAWLQLLWRDSHWAARLGYGYLLGIFAVTLIMRVWGGFGLALNFTFIAVLIFVLSVMPLFFLSVKATSKACIKFVPFHASWQRLVVFLLLSILLVRYGWILLEIIWRPLYPWDAWMNWAPKAKIWFELKELIPIVTMRDWPLASIYNAAYTLGSPPASTYPPTLPLIQTWTALGMGVWKDNLVNLPWGLCTVALGLSFYGQGRMLGAAPLSTVIFLFLILSIPYTNVHTALAGYAELWLAAFYALAGMSFINWSQTRDTKQAVLCVIFAIACAQTKNPGIIWASFFIPASIFVFLPRRWGYISVGLIAAALVALILLGGFSLHFGGVELTLKPDIIRITGLGSFPIGYHPVGKMFFTNYLIFGSWHLLGWLLLVLAVPLVVIAIYSYKYFAATVLMVLGVLFLCFVFFFTSHYKAALDSTTINRAAFHMLPLLCFYMLFMMMSLRADGVAKKTEVRNYGA